MNNNNYEMDGHNNPWSNLDTLDTIEKDMNDLLNQPQQLSYNTLLHMFEGIRSQLVQWMEKAHLAIFTLEQQMKDGTIKTNILPLQSKVTKMESLMTRLPDISDMIDDKIDRTIENDDKSTQQIQFNMTITKLQSEWSGLHHFMLSVTKQFEAANEKRELLVIMEDILLNIDSLTSTIFQYQEKRHLAMVTTDNDDSTTSNTLKDESLLSDIDQRVDPVFLNVEKVYARMTSSRPPLDESGILVRKHRLVQEKWECLRIEIDELKDELKEDKWLFVFRQVADQVDTMINGLDKTVQQCYNTIQQIMDWHEQVQQQQQQLSSPHSPSTFDKLSKTFLRSTRNHNSSASVSSTTSSTVSIVPPLDREKFKAVEKNFEAKYKYYTPSIDRMLTMLGNGIASRVTKDSSTCKRQSAMLSRWQQLKTAMDDLRTRDLMDAERYLVETPLSPANSVQSDRSHHGMWRSIRRRPSEQEYSTTDFNPKVRATSTISGLPRLNPSTSQHEDHRRVRSVTPSCGSHHQHHDNNYYRSSSNVYSRQQRTTSPLHFSVQSSTSSHNNRLLRPSTSETSSVDSQSYRPNVTGRKSLTPHRPAWNTSTKPDKPEFSTLEPLWKGESRANAGQINDDSPRQQHHQQGRKSHVPRPPSQQRHTKEASFMKPTKSTMLRTRSQSVEPPEIIRPKTPTRTKPTGNTNGGRRTKTPGTTTTTNSSAHLQYHLPPRPKSSLARQETYDMLPYVDRERQNGTKSPIRRTGTPSLIPRPKTPSGQKELMIRSASPSMIPRPRSSMKQYQDGQVIPPVPPLPSNIERPSIHLLKVGILNKEDVCNDDDGSGGGGDDDNSLPSSSYVFPGSFLSVPSIFDSDESAPLYQQENYAQQRQKNSTIHSNNNTINTNNDLDKQQRRRELLKKRSMPALAMQRSGSPFRSPATIKSTQQKQPSHSVQPTNTVSRRRRRSGYYSEDEDGSELDGMLSPHGFAFQEHPIYTGDPRDPLDMEVATILNSSPIAMQCQRSPQGGGKYYFGNELNPTLGGGKKLYTCKLINYSGRSSRRTHNNGDHVSMVTRNKVLVRVGGGWTELPQFLLDHALSLGNSTGLVIRHPVDQGAHQDTTVSSSSSSSYQDPSLHRFRSKRSPSMSSSNTDNTSGFLLDAHSSF